MKKIVMTQEILDEYKEKWKGRMPLKPDWLYCKLCSNLKYRHGVAKGFRPGETVYKVTYQDGNVAYYHVECIDKAETIYSPWYKSLIKRIGILDANTWQDLPDFLETLGGIEKKEKIKRIMQRYGCSHTTAWRKLKAYQSQC